MTEQLLFKKVVDMSVLNQCIRNVSITKILTLSAVKAAQFHSFIMVILASKLLTNT